MMNMPPSMDPNAGGPPMGGPPAGMPAPPAMPAPILMPKKKKGMGKRRKHGRAIKTKRKA